MKKNIIKLIFAVAVGIIAGLLYINQVVYAANTVTKSGNVITISSIDSDWLWSSNYPTNGVKIKTIFFKPGAADDACIIKEGSDSGPPILDVVAADTYDQRQGIYGGARLRPVLDYSAGTYSAGSTVTIIIGE